VRVPGGRLVQVDAGDVETDHARGHLESIAATIAAPSSSIRRAEATASSGA